MTISVAQVRAARGLIGWNQRTLADAADVGISTVADFESGKRQPMPTSLNAIRRALEGAGVMFLARGREGEGVRMRRTPSTTQEGGTR